MHLVGFAKKKFSANCATPIGAAVNLVASVVLGSLSFCRFIFDVAPPLVVIARDVVNGVVNVGFGVAVGVDAE